MNTRDFFTGKSLTEHKKTHSLDFSRHLCVGTRSNVSMDKRPSRSFSDTDAVIRKLKEHGSYGDFKRNATLFGERTSQKQVYHMDKTFHKKYGNKNEGAEIYASTPAIHRSWVNSPTSSIYCGANEDDCARSFCDSVSSIACSNFTNADVEKRSKRKCVGLTDKMAKFNAIELWLQNLSKPVLQHAL